MKLGSALAVAIGFLVLGEPGRVLPFRRQWLMKCLGPFNESITTRSRFWRAEHRNQSLSHGSQRTRNFSRTADLQQLTRCRSGARCRSVAVTPSSAPRRCFIAFPGTPLQSTKKANHG